MSETGGGFWASYPSPYEEYAVVVEETEDCCWAYLVQGETIVGDVWLYNIPVPDPNPIRRGIPPSNPDARDLSFPRFEREDDLRLKWSGAPETIDVEIFVRRALHARVSEGVKPGWCVLAARDNRIAKVLVEESPIRISIPKKRRRWGWFGRKE
ncbi:MAG: hypothetical protein ACO1SV_25775 [Fimbriimonas sp.]